MSKSSLLALDRDHLIHPVSSFRGHESVVRAAAETSCKDCHLPPPMSGVLCADGRCTTELGQAIATLVARGN